MERKDIGSCSLCNKLRDELKILPCAHNFCLKCLESWVRSSDSPKCPQCDVAFKIPRGGLKDLKKNEFLEYLNKLLANKSKCDSCNENQAVNFCIDCSFHYCLTCLQYHGKNPYTRKHRLIQTEVTEVETLTPGKYKVCEVHSEAMNLYCEDCSVFTCCVCFASNHNTHKVKHISVKVDEKKKYLDLKIKTSEEDFLVTVAKFQMTERRLCGCKTKAAKLKKEIQQRGEAIKGLVDSIVAEMNEKVDKELAQHEEEAGVVLKKLKEMETDLNAQIETLKQQLNNLNHQNIAELTYSKLIEKLEFPKYSNSFKLCMNPFRANIKLDLENLIGMLIKSVVPELFKEICLTGKAISVCAGQANIYVGRSDAPVVDVFDETSFKHSELFVDRCLSEIFDSETTDTALFVCGRQRDMCKVIKISKPPRLQVIYKFQCGSSYPTLTKSLKGNLIINLKSGLVLLSDDGTILGRLSYKSFNNNNNVEHVLQLDDDRYLAVCSYVRGPSLRMCSGVSVLDFQKETKVDYHIDVIGGFEILKEECIQTSSSNMKSYALQPSKPRCFVKYIARDSNGNICVSNRNNIFVLDQKINIIFTFETSNDHTAISYDVRRNVLLVSGIRRSGESILSVYKLPNANLNNNVSV